MSRPGSGCRPGHTLKQTNMKKIHGLTDAENMAYNNRERAEIAILIAIGFLVGVLFSIIFLL